MQAANTEGGAQCAGGLGGGAHLMSCCTRAVMLRPAMGMDWMAGAMTWPCDTGMTCVHPSPLSITVPVSAPACGQCAATAKPLGWPS